MHKFILFLLLILIFLLGCTVTEYNNINTAQKLKPSMDKNKLIEISLKDDGVENPDIWEDYIVFNNRGENGNIDIYLYYIPTQKIERITYDNTAQSQPHISNNKIFWFDKRERVSPIYMYNLEQKESKPLEITGAKGFLVIDVHKDNLLSSGIEVFNFKKSNITKLPLPYGNSDYSHLYDDLVIGQTNFRPHLNDIIIYNLKENKLTILNKSYVQQEPDIYENKVVWSDNRNGEENFDIYMYNLDTKEEVQITNSPDASETNPSIHGRYIVYIKNKQGMFNERTGYDAFKDIYYYNIETKEEVKIPKTKDFWKKNLKVYDNKIIWHTCKNSWCASKDEVIYLYIIE